MYNKKVQGFSERLFYYQKEISFDVFLGLSDSALKKINLVAIEKLTHNTNLDDLNTFLENDFINGNKGNLWKCIINKILLLLFLFPFHLLLLLRKIFKYDEFNIKSSKIIFFGFQSSTIANGYRFLSSLFPNSSFYALTGIFGVINFKRQNTFTGFEANSNSFFRALKFIDYFITKLCRLNILERMSLKARILFLAEFIKVLYSIEKSKIIAIQTPENSINIFMCDNNFFHTVHIDRLNNTECVTAIIQHGTFLAGNIIYLPALSKWILCCSERESMLFALTTPKSKIHVLGMPLQISLELKNKEESIKTSIQKSFDLLILGRDGNLWEIESAYKVFNEKGSYFSDKSILIRHHPKSNKEMKVMLESKFSNYTLSLNSTLSRDIDCSNIIISFSVDANIICMIKKKKTIFCGEPEADDLGFFGNIFENLKVATLFKELENKIKYLSSNIVQFDDNYENELIDNFGDYSIDTIETNYIDFICQCQNKNI